MTDNISSHDQPAGNLTPSGAPPQAGAPREALAERAAEFQHATQNAALFDLGSRTQLELTGKDRQKYLHNFCTNEIRNLQPGQSCEAFVTTIQGKIKAHIFVFAGQDSLWIDSVAGNEDLLFSHLDKYLITEDVQFARGSAEFVEFYVTGPKCLSRLTDLGLPGSELVPQTHRAASLEGVALSIRRVDWLGGPGCLIQVPNEGAGRVKAALIQGGLPEAGRSVFDALRIAAGFPEYGVDLTAENLAQEAARTELAISFNKGCYLGQEPIARIDSMGHVNQELRTLRLASGPIPEAGAKVVLPGEVREAGTVTSAAWDYGAGTPIAMALLKRNYLAPGKQLAVVIGELDIPATVLGESKI